MCIRDRFQEAELDDHGVILEYQLPLSSRRLDCIVTGHDERRFANAVIMCSRGVGLLPS